MVTSVVTRALKSEVGLEDHECDSWETLHEVRFITDPDDKAYVEGDVGTEHDSPYRVETCEHGYKRIVPFTPEELQIVEVIDNVRADHVSGVTKTVRAEE